MGWGTVVEHLGDGQYRVRMDYGTRFRDARIELIDERLDDLEQSISDIEAGTPDLESAVTAAQADLDSAIAAYRAAASGAAPGESLESERAATQQAARDLMAAQDNLATHQARMEEFETLQTRWEQEKTALNDAELEPELDVWCCDYTLDAEGEVTTVEIPGEPETVLVAPEAEPRSAESGQLLARIVQFSHQVFFNAAILPGWQKFLPTYRIGTITEIAGDLCTLELAEALSSAQDLDVNAVEILEEVPIEYMGCNGGAFQEGDEVVVHFRDQSWDDPVVIGFREKPVGCKRFVFAVVDGETGQLVGDGGRGELGGDNPQVSLFMGRQPRENALPLQPPGRVSHAEPEGFFASASVPVICSWANPWTGQAVTVYPEGGSHYITWRNGAMTAQAGGAVKAAWMFAGELYFIDDWNIYKIQGEEFIFQNAIIGAPDTYRDGSDMPYFPHIAPNGKVCILLSARARVIITCDEETGAVPVVETNEVYRGTVTPGEDWSYSGSLWIHIKWLGSTPDDAHLYEPVVFSVSASADSDGSSTSMSWTGGGYALSVTGDYFNDDDGSPVGSTSGTMPLEMYPNAEYLLAEDYLLDRSDPDDPTATYYGRYVTVGGEQIAQGQPFSGSQSGNDDNVDWVLGYKGHGLTSPHSDKGLAYVRALGPALMIAVNTIESGKHAPGERDRLYVTGYYDGATLHDIHTLSDQWSMDAQDRITDIYLL